MVESLKDKEYRVLFVSEEIDTGLPYQIRAMRQDRGWSQEELAARTGMKQATISRVESVDYGRYSLQTLKRLASAFDVALTVRFAPFSVLVDAFVDLSDNDLRISSFSDDVGLRRSADMVRALGSPTPFASSPSTTHVDQIAKHLNWAKFHLANADLQIEQGQRLLDDVMVASTIAQTDVGGSEDPRGRSYVGSRQAQAA